MAHVMNNNDITVTNNCPYYGLYGECLSPVEDHPYSCNNNSVETIFCMNRPLASLNIKFE